MAVRSWMVALAVAALLIVDRGEWTELGLCDLVMVDELVVGAETGTEASCEASVFCIYLLSVPLHCGWEKLWVRRKETWVQILTLAQNYKNPSSLGASVSPAVA